jgi:hypothetical protein
MKALGYLKFTFVFLLFSFRLYGQANTDNNCGKALKGFIYDTQEYLIDPKENTTFDLVFYPGFTYRLELCSQNPKISLSFTLVDEKGNEQFKNIINQGFYRDFNFDTIFHGKLQVKPISMDKQPAQIIIGFKKNKK